MCHRPSLRARRKLLQRRRLRKPLMKLLQPSPLLLRQPAALNSVRRFHRLTWVKMTGTGTGAELASFSLKFQGYPYVAGGNTPAGWDCSGFVQYVFSQFGISLPRTSGAQATVGTPVASLADAKPGDILANGTHAAIYIGNGQVMNAMNPVQGTAVSDVSVFGGAGYSIRRVM